MTRAVLVLSLVLGCSAERLTRAELKAAHQACAEIPYSAFDDPNVRLFCENVNDEFEGGAGSGAE